MSKARKARVKRVENHPYSRLSQPEMTELMLAPYLHLHQLIVEKTPSPHYLASIVGVFNVATALAYMDKDKRSISLYESIQQTVLVVAHSGIQDQETADRLLRVFGIADHYIGVHSKADVLRAIHLVEYQIAHGEGSVPLPAAA